MSALATGAELPTWEVASVNADAMKALAIILDDPNPIHTDPAAAEALGLGPRAINQGPANLGYVYNMLGAAFPGGVTRGLRVRLLANVAAKDHVVAGGRVEAVEDAGGERVVTCAVWLDVRSGARAIEGSAVVALPGRAARRRRRARRR